MQDGITQKEIIALEKKKSIELAKADLKTKRQINKNKPKDPLDGVDQIILKRQGNDWFAAAKRKSCLDKSPTEAILGLLFKLEDGEFNFESSRVVAEKAGIVGQIVTCNIVDLRRGCSVDNENFYTVVFTTNQELNIGKLEKAIQRGLSRSREHESVSLEDLAED